MAHDGAGKNPGRDTWEALEPYAQVMRALLPRVLSVTVFDPNGKLRWSTEATTGPDLVHLIGEVRADARGEAAAAGELRLLEGNIPVYVCWLRDESSQPLAVVAITCRAGERAGEGEPRPFTFVHALLRPALECLRRDLLAHTSIANLREAVSDLDHDLDLLVLEPSCSAGPASSVADELKALLQAAIERLRCAMGALIVPEKSVAVIVTAGDHKPDSLFLARTHRQLVSMAQMRPGPVIINHPQPGATGGKLYRILSCPVQRTTGRSMGVLVFFRLEEANEFLARDARLAELMAKRAASMIESQYDALTGLPTLASMKRALRTALASRSTSGPWCVLYVDADELHSINDNFGMHVGDAIVIQLAELIRSRLPPSALAARIAGDRFAIALPSEIEDAARFAEALRTSAELLAAKHTAPPLRFSVSIGVAPLENGADELKDAFVSAETACKTAKDRGRNRIVLFEADDASLARRVADLHIARRLREAIEADELQLDTQLIVPLGESRRGRPHFEVLVRLNSADGTIVGPDHFLAAAQRHELMGTIDRWVIERTIALLRPQAPLLARQPAVFAINLSAQSLRDEGFADFLVTALEESGLPPGVFCFEITESAMTLNVARTELLMRRLRRLGCEVALDDFGTGVASLTSLRQLPVTKLKIDGSFVRDILKDNRAESMVQAIAQLAHTLSLETVAKHVETEEIRSRIAALGIDYGQGFSIGRPEPFAELLAQLPILAAAVPVEEVPAEATPADPTDAVNL